MSVNDCVYDKDDVIRNLKLIEEVIPVDQLQYFNYCASEIESAVDYLIARLSHSESERFNN